MGTRKEIIVRPYSGIPWYYLFARIKASIFPFISIIRLEIQRM